ncbi:MAG: phosphatase PAP2 family protein [Acidimicrobiia bacterium]|nr:phosphatase PAP2 family protein [Acidimicrobiia bacterium]
MALHHHLTAPITTLAPDPESTTDLPRPARRGWWLRAGPGLAYVTAVVLVVATRGFPLERAQVLLWLMGALVIATTGRPGGGAARVLRDWVPLGVLLAAYDLSRGLADTLGMPVQVSSLVDVERGLFGGVVPTVWAQDRLGPYVGDARWWEVPVALVYLSHFVVAFLLLALLWARDRPRFGAFRSRFLTLTAAGLATYVLLPAAPPWMASEAGLIGPVRRVGLRGLEPLGLHTAEALLRYGARFGNTVAALPSMHAGWAALVALFVCTYVSRRWWPVLVAYPLWMGTALVISGEHYVVDILLGYLYAVATLLGWAWWDRRRAHGARSRAQDDDLVTGTA